MAKTKEQRWVLKRESLIHPKDWERVLSVLQTFPVRDQVLIHLLASAGLRREEASCLNVDDLRLDATPQPYLIVRHGKGDKYGEVVIPSRVADMLRAFCGFRRDGPLFLGRKRAVNDGRMSGDRVNRIVSAVGEAAGLPNLHAHSLRHFFATSTLRQSGSLEFTRAQLRHSSLKVTQVYLDLFIEDGSRFVEALDRLLTNPVAVVCGTPVDARRHDAAAQ